MKLSEKIKMPCYMTIRCEAKSIIYTFGSTFSDLNVDCFSVSSWLDKPLKYRYLRSNIIDVIDEYNITSVSIKKIERNSKNVVYDRIEMEGVIQEALASSSVSFYKEVYTQSLLKSLSIDKSEFHNSIKNIKNFKSFFESYGLLSYTDSFFKKHKSTAHRECSLFWLSDWHKSLEKKL